MRTPARHVRESGVPALWAFGTSAPGPGCLAAIRGHLPPQTVLTQRMPWSSPCAGALRSCSPQARPPSRRTGLDGHRPTLLRVPASVRLAPRSARRVAACGTCQITCARVELTGRGCRDHGRGVNAFGLVCAQGAPTPITAGLPRERDVRGRPRSGSAREAGLGRVVGVARSCGRITCA
jgi:hypothetical protein